MNPIMIDLESGLFALAGLLRVPVMVLLWAAVLWTLFMLGRFVTDLLARKRQREGFRLEQWCETTELSSLGEGPVKGLPYFNAVFLNRALPLVRQGKGSHQVEIENVLGGVLELVRHQADGARILTKVGPSLGLLGTLIPMGAALAALSTGNLEAMSGQMVVAFSTTVVGLACGTLAFYVSVIQQRWVSEDSRECRYLAEWILDRSEKEA